MGIFDGLLGSVVSGIGNLIGGASAANTAEDNAIRNIDAQREFATHGIQWKVADAKAAGINPLAALGAQTNSFSNVVGDDGAFGRGIAAAGQDVGRALMATQDKEDKKDVLERQLLEARIANINADTVRTQAAASHAVRTFGAPGSAPGVPLPRPNVRAPGFSMEKYNAKPLFELYSDGRGGFVDLPTGSASTAMQNWASMPSQVAVAAGLGGRIPERAADALIPSGTGTYTAPDSKWYSPF